MNSALLSILGLSFVGSVLGLIGGLALLFNVNFAKKFSILLISFAAGGILAAAFLDLLPEAVARGGESVFTFALIGLVAFFLIEDFILHFHHHEKHSHSLKSAVPLLLFSDSIHNFIDGIVIAASFLTDPKLGLVVAVATFLHEVPQEIGDFAVLLSVGFGKRNTLIAHLLTSLTTFLGAILTYFFFAHSQNLMGPLLSLATGMFLYIASADILPELVHDSHRDLRWRIAGVFLFGVALIYFLTKFIPD